MVIPICQDILLRCYICFDANDEALLLQQIGDNIDDIFQRLYLFLHGSTHACVYEADGIRYVQG